MTRFTRYDFHLIAHSKNLILDQIQRVIFVQHYKSFLIFSQSPLLSDRVIKK